MRRRRLASRPGLRSTQHRCRTLPARTSCRRTTTGDPIDTGAHRPQGESTMINYLPGGSGPVACVSGSPRSRSCSRPGSAGRWCWCGRSKVAHAAAYSPASASRSAPSYTRWLRPWVCRRFSRLRRFRHGRQVRGRALLGGARGAGVMARAAVGPCRRGRRPGCDRPGSRLVLHAAMTGVLKPRLCAITAGDGTIRLSGFRVRERSKEGPS